jgi:SAM-dependent methyltransferase
VPIVRLPDVDTFASLSDHAWSSLGRRLHAIGVDDRLVGPHWAKALLGGSPQQSPIVKWNLRRRREPASDAMRMFVFWDPVTPDEAQAVLGEDLALDQLLQAGLLRSAPDGGIVSPFLLKTVGMTRGAEHSALYILCDDLNAGGDAVMGPSPATVGLGSIAIPRTRLPRALDLGCGAGTVALMLALACEKVVATDISPRALAVARANTLLNGIDNVELRLGDLFAPVQGESFDAIASQPPFVPRPDGAEETLFLFGGDRGDELPLRVLRDVGAYLVPGGIASLMVEWPVIEGDPPLEGRLRGAVGPSADLSLLIVQTGLSDLDVHCAAYGQIRHHGLEGDRERVTMLHREHLEQRKIRSLVATYTMVRRETSNGVAWTATRSAADLGAAPLTHETVEAIFAARGQPTPQPSSPVPAPSPGSVDPLSMPSALPMADNLALAGRSEQAIALYRNVLERAPASRDALLGIARLEIARGTSDGWPAKLGPMAELGDPEARRLLGDVHWNRGEMEAALGWYSLHRRAPAAIRSSYTKCALHNDARVVRRADAKRPFLVWVSCPSFARSVAGRWFQPDRPRLWDLAVNSFQPGDEPFCEQAEHIVLGGPSKLSCVKAAFAADGNLFDGYRAVLLLDDDIGILHEDVDRFFWSMFRHQLELAHPSFSEDSAGGSRAIFQQRESVVRFTNCVDVRAPAFSGAALATCVDSFDQSISGGGLPHVWAHLLRDRRHAIGVVDAVVARHLRPVDPIEGPFYKHLRALGVDPDQETFKVYAQYGCSFFRARTLGEVDALGHERHYPD